MKERKLLTKSEYQVMHILWNLPQVSAFTGEILAKYDNPKPAYTTLATFLKILTTKGFVKSKKIGSMLSFTPAISQEEYADLLIKYEREDFFNNDIVKHIEFLVNHQELTNEQIDTIVSILNQKKA